MTDTESKIRTANRALTNFAAIVRRVERNGYGRNENGTRSAARYGFERSLVAVLAVEDAAGVETAAALSDRLTATRQRAIAAGLFTPADVAAIERRVIPWMASRKADR